MKKEFNIGNLDLNEIKDKFNEIKEASEKAKKEQAIKESTGKVTPQSLGNKILGIIILIALVIGIGFILVSNLDMLLLPKNSVTIVVSDENDNAINGLKIEIRGEQTYYQEFEDIKDVTILDVAPGDYNLYFEYVPSGYYCSTINDKFTLKQNGKEKLEYKCEKES